MMHTNRAITRPSSESVSMRPIGDRQTPVKTLPSLAVGNNLQKTHVTGAGQGRAHEITHSLLGYAVRITDI